MSNREPCPPGCKVYIGGLPQGASQDELREKFEVFGPLRHVWVARNPWGFAFVEFEDSRDAQDSIRELDQTHLCGVKVTVQLSRGRRRNSNFNRDDRYKRQYKYVRRFIINLALCQALRVMTHLIIEMKDIKIDTVGALDHQCDVHIDKCSGDTRKLEEEI
ncbi:Serine/arginine-rich splicing factor 3 [Trichinella papuae]|uniref:Serine/arginine-rich splicing factor 3 n=1 Tax=Trichinella papuae TaxID=268474 RepID=A0A0V1MBG1_9BILA|nr:Serine/arginine-rich splicing factor 3 [Trichinella papuae]